MNRPLLLDISQFFWSDMPSRVLEENWENWARVVGASCGVFVYRSETEDSLEERLSFGYGEEGFFYDFMARGKSLWNHVSQKQTPISVAGKNEILFLGEGAFAYTIGIHEEGRFLGFVLMEVSGSYNPVFEIFLDSVSRIWEKKSPVAPAGFSAPSRPQPLQGIPSFPIIEIYLQKHEPLKESMPQGKDRAYRLILGPEGSGKKSLAKYIHQSFPKTGEFVLINSIPEQVVKLEKAFANWLEISIQGSLALEGISHLQMGQQRFFFEVLQEISPEKHQILFLDRNEKRKEIYPPFWELLHQNALVLPPLSSLALELRKEVIHALFQQISVQQGKPQLKLSGLALGLLANSPLPGNLEEIQNNLEMAVWNSSGDEIQVEDLQKGKTFNIGMPNSEDLNLRKAVDILERQKILLASKLFSGNQVRMAKALGISRGSLQYKIKHLGIED